MKTIKITRPPLESLACVNPECKKYGQKGQNNLKVRKVYGQDHIRYLRCKDCGEEFSERKNTALWNCKIGEGQAVAVAEHLAEGCAFKSTARLARVDARMVRRLNRRLGRHGEQYHEQSGERVAVKVLEADERYGFARSKQQPVWEAELIDPKASLSWLMFRNDEMKG